MSCVRCSKSHCDAREWLLKCSSCDPPRFWHHKCHIPPIGIKELTRLINASADGCEEEGLESWRCRRCSKKTAAAATTSTTPKLQDVASSSPTILQAEREDEIRQQDDRRESQPASAGSTPSSSRVFKSPFPWVSHRNRANSNLRSDSGASRPPPPMRHVQLHSPSGSSSVSIVFDSGLELAALQSLSSPSSSTRNGLDISLFRRTPQRSQSAVVVAPPLSGSGSSWSVGGSGSRVGADQTQTRTASHFDRTPTGSTTPRRPITALQPVAKQTQRLPVQVGEVIDLTSIDDVDPPSSPIQIIERPVSHLDRHASLAEPQRALSPPLPPPLPTSHDSTTTSKLQQALVQLEHLRVDNHIPPPPPSRPPKTQTQLSEPTHGVKPNYLLRCRDKDAFWEIKHANESDDIRKPRKTQATSRLGSRAKRKKEKTLLNFVGPLNI